MKKIRLNVFETNSSSTHVITISKHKDKLYDTLNVNPDGTVIVYGGQFYDGHELTKPTEKASYVATVIQAEDCWDSNGYRKILADVIKEQTGCANVIYCKDTIDSSFASDSEGLDSVFDMDNLASDFRDFIFNPNSRVEIIDRDGDYY
jgi:hypothetical protein